MLVEDTSAFIEQLEVPGHDRRAEKRRRRLAQAELEVLEAQAEARLASEALAAIEKQLADVPPAAHAESGRRLLRGGYRRALEREREVIRARLDTVIGLLAARRQRVRDLRTQVVELATPQPGPRVFRLHFRQHHLECSERRFTRLASSQVEQPVLVTRRDGATWWWYQDRFWRGDEALAARDVRALVDETSLRRRQKAEALTKARAAILGEVDVRLVEESVSQVVRFAVWCRDRGRCADCGTTEGVACDEILPRSKGGSKVAANVELRCTSCRERRSHNEVRARVDRARIDATPLWR